jgi:hypothetical protein
MAHRKVTIVVESDVSIPRKSKRGNSYRIHPLNWLLRKIKAGESFIYPAATHEKFTVLQAIAHQIGKQLGRKFVTRTVTDREGVDRLRFWRTA